MIKNTLENIHFKSRNIPYFEKNPKKAKLFHFSSHNIIIYDDGLSNKNKILQDNKQRCGVYKWVNKINSKSYIGSSVNLSSRLSHYFSLNYLAKRTSKYKSKIYNALLAHGHDNFQLEILEVCGRSDLIKKEQSYIDYFKSEGNILTKAGSSLHFKHSEETLLKFKPRKLSDQARSNLIKAKVGAVLSPLAKTNQLLSTSYTITLKNVETNYTREYSSIRAAAREFKVSHATLLNYIKKDKLFKGKYMIMRKK